jgi:hypothetical protein
MIFFGFFGGFIDGVWLRLADDDVSELFARSVFPRNIVVSQPEPHIVDKPKKPDL